MSRQPATHIAGERTGPRQYIAGERAEPRPDRTRDNQHTSSHR